MKQIIVTLTMLASFAISAYGACAPGEGILIAEVKSNPYSITFASISEAIRIGEQFSVIAVVCDQKGTLADVNFSMDAWMPHHNHGMNYRPKITKKSAGRFLVEGLMMHMPGMWQFTFKIGEGDSTVRLTSDYVLKK